MKLKNKVGFLPEVQVLVHAQDKVQPEAATCDSLFGNIGQCCDDKSLKIPGINLFFFFTWMLTLMLIYIQGSLCVEIK